MRGLSSQANQWKAPRLETFSEVGWKAVCAERRKHGSEGGQGFLRDRLPYPTLEQVSGGEVPSLGIRNAFLQIGDAQIELITPLSEQGPVADFLGKHGGGMYLLALEVDNLDEAITTLQQQGARVNVATGSSGQRLAFVSPRSTHGVLLQLLERRGVEVQKS